jgi:hypothetical protein
MESWTVESLIQLVNVGVASGRIVWPTYDILLPLNILSKHILVGVGVIVMLMTNDIVVATVKTNGLLVPCENLNLKRCYRC